MKAKKNGSFPMSVKTSYMTSLQIYDIFGREMATLVNEYQKPGLYNAEFRAQSSGLSSGAYFYQIQVKDYSNKLLFNQNKKLVYLK
ncbi:hypothetical protein [Stygiobacter electus]|uniref:Secretion system C-terminal sorting domain-containing protein n=1 Tax=Stygiobacter electus TaxID=3032292 RepID=A0AAE3P4I7_9BACT|nr:hypothetical protein [Stygiobacter electus]MDF1612820.1 hypothetical protein [Stygiobacter electus]